MSPRIYLDNAATTAVAPDVVTAMLPYFTREYGNASSVHAFGQQARTAVETARKSVARLIGAHPTEIIFLSGGTEADNLALRGLTAAHGEPGKHIITTAFEHPAVLGPCAALEREGFRVTRLPVHENGRIRMEDLRAALTDDTILISVMFANNEVGTLQPIADIGRLVRDLRATGRKLFFHTDAVQAVGKVPISVHDLGIDALSLSGHKFHAPKGIGALFLAREVRLVSQQLGGRHERDRRAGTENVAGIVALGVAADLARAGLPDMDRIARLRDAFEEQVRGAIPETQINGERTERLPTVSNLSFAGLDAESLLIALDLNGVAVSTGSACSSGSTEPSHVLTAMGLSRDRIRASLRVSLSGYTTAEETATVARLLPALIERQRRRASAGG